MSTRSRCDTGPVTSPLTVGDPVNRHRAIFLPVGNLAGVSRSARVRNIVRNNIESRLVRLGRIEAMSNAMPT